jgi:hypothetical protein
MRCCSSLTPGLLNPAFKPLGGRGPILGLFVLLGPDGLTNGLLKVDPGFLNPLIITSAFLVYNFYFFSNVRRTPLENPFGKNRFLFYR